MTRFRSRPARDLIFVLALAVSSAVAAVAVRADEPETLFLKNGDRYTGSSFGMLDEQLRWLTPFGTELLIPLEDVDRLELIVPASAAEIPPAPIERPLGVDPLLDAAPDVPLPPSWFESIPFSSPLGRAYDAASQTALLWTKRFQVGGQFINGNGETNVIDVLADFERGDANYLRQFDAGGQFAEANQKTTANRWWVNGNIDYPVRDKWVWFATTKNEYNRLTNLDYRGTLSMGPGYRFVNEKVKRLIVRMGPGVTTEIFRDPFVYRTTPDLFGELEVRWPVFDRTIFETKTRANPSLENFELVRVLNNSAILIDLDDSQRWKFRLGFRYEFNSVPAAGRNPNEFLTTLSLVYLRK